MRLMSFSLTTAAFLAGTKDVTRRLGWTKLKRGDRFMAVEKCMGLKKGEKVRRLGECICLSNEPEPLSDIIREPYRKLRIIDVYHVLPETVREGFLISPEEFVAMFCKKMKCDPETVVNRIEFLQVARVV